MAKRRLTAVTSRIPNFETIRLSSPKCARNVPNHLLALDPGETLGWSFARGGKFDIAAQIKNATFQDLRSIVDHFEPDLVVMESFRLYPWKADQQAFSSLYTPRLIGALEYILDERKIPRAFQSAQMG